MVVAQCGEHDRDADPLADAQPGAHREVVERQQLAGPGVVAHCQADRGLTAAHPVHHDPPARVPGPPVARSGEARGREARGREAGGREAGGRETGGGEAGRGGGVRRLGGRGQQRGGDRDGQAGGEHGAGEPVGESHGESLRRRPPRP
jgi:hypothetical protein